MNPNDVVGLTMGGGETLVQFGQQAGSLIARHVRDVGHVLVDEGSVQVAATTRSTSVVASGLLGRSHPIIRPAGAAVQ